MHPDHYVWLIWSVAFLLPWLIVYTAFPAHRHAMLWSSFYTMPFGLTEPLFVPEYWSPPSLFNLAAKTGFDIESLVFCFGIGGIAAVLYNLISRQILQPPPESERYRPLHRHHYKALSAPFFVFVILYFFDWNPIYPALIAMLSGVVANVLCRPDLKPRVWVGGSLFLAYYAIFLTGLELTAPGYIERVWNHATLSGWHLGFMPVEELGFALAFGMYWSGVYEHFTWKK